MIVYHIIRGIIFFIQEWCSKNIAHKPSCIYFLTSIEDIKKARYIVLSENNILCTRHEYAICFTSICNEAFIRDGFTNIITEYRYGTSIYLEGFLLANTKQIIKIANDKKNMFCFSWWVKNYITHERHKPSNTIAVLVPKMYWKRFNIKDGI